MAPERDNDSPTLALSTKLEEDFVSPLTAMRGSLEILRDFPQLASEQQQRFIAMALLECERLERGVQALAETVYAAGNRAMACDAPSPPPGAGQADDAAARIRFLDRHDAVEVDFSDMTFSSSRLVNDFYDVLDRLVESSGRSWYFVVNYRHCTVWPEAWVAFAHRGKKVNVSYSLGTVRYVEDGDALAAGSGGDDGMFSSRQAALAHIDALRRGAAAQPGAGARR